MYERRRAQLRYGSAVHSYSYHETYLHHIHNRSFSSIQAILCHSRFFVYHIIRTSLYVGILMFSVQTRCKMRKRCPCTIFKERPSIVMMHIKWGMQSCGPMEGHISRLYTFGGWSNTSFVRICVWGQTRDWNGADLSTLSENASFNDFAHSRAQGRSWESQPLEIVVSIPLPSLLYNTLICSEQNRW